MTLRSKKWLRRTLMTFGVLLCAVGVLLGFLSVSAITAGLYPPDGNSSLGHFGAILGGIIGCFLTLISELLGIFMMQKARKISLQHPEPPPVQEPATSSRN